jgi:hypothetical protein
MVLDWSKVLHALEYSPGCVDETKHDKFMELKLRDRIILRDDAFYYDNNVGMEEVYIEDSELTYHSELHKYGLMQSVLWWNQFNWHNYPVVPNAKEVVMTKFPYITDEIATKLETSRKFYNYQTQ